MKIIVHRRITEKSLQGQVAPEALQTILAANVAQDGLRYQLGRYAHFHYDADSFAAGDAYLVEQRALIVDALEQGDASAARSAFGRLTHTAQDFYAHSNYIALWLERNPNSMPDQIAPLAADVLSDSRLRSGHLYYPLEALSFVPALAPLVMPFLPRNSHAWMNIDGPDRPLFAYAFSAAVQRTRVEFDRAMLSLTVEAQGMFTGK
jgi:hypothetical protein